VLKDEGRSAKGLERQNIYRKAAEAYARAAALSGKTYPLINAATLTLLAGHSRKSHALARALLARNDDQEETPYWRIATRAEALLLLGRVAEAESALRQAIPEAPQAFEDHAATLRQFGLICGVLSRDKTWLDQFRPPRCLHFAGPMVFARDEEPRLRRQVRAIIDQEQIGAGFGAVAAGADIVIAEALLERNAEIHIVLPAPTHLFRETSVSKYRRNWGARFDAVLQAAASCRALEQEAAAPFRLAIRLAGEIAMGNATMHAEMFQTEAVQLAVLAAKSTKSPDLSCSARMASRWNECGHRGHILRVRGGGYRSGDLQAYFQKIGVRLPTVSSILIDHAGNEPTSADSADGEVMLDIEVAGAVAPGANIAVYFAPNNGDQGFLDAISAAIHDAERTPTVISISWGGPENNNDRQAINAYHELFAAAAVLGITICVASGDHGTADMDALHWDQGMHVDHPACDDLVLACGGTQTDDANGPDVAWNDGTPFSVTTSDGGGWATGGGISTIFTLPTYQENVGVPVSIDTGQPGRGVPDIAMSAVNYFVRVDSYEGISGGTSAVAPLMAGLVARLNQAKRNRLGFLNPFLYSHAGGGVVHDVVVGTNEIRNTLRGYAAGPGWDACTGLGTPDGLAILNAL
jgi:tetratricopeptide (TPR) repeat protein